MREWRKARKDYAEKVKQKIKEKQNVEDTYPKLAVPIENKTVSLSPTQSLESKPSIIQPTAPLNHIEAAIQHLRDRAKGL